MNEQFFASIAGSFVTLLGVLITLRWSQVSHERNLTHERLKRKDEREFAARQQTFSATAEAITRFTQELLTLPDRDLPVGGAIDSTLQNLGVALSKLQFYATIETIEKAAAVSNILTNAYGQTVHAKMPSMFLNEEIKGLDLCIQNFEKQIADLRFETNVLFQTQPQSSVITANHNTIATCWGEISSLHDKKGKLIKEKYKATEACRDLLHKSIPMIFTSQRDLLLSARKELGFDIDTDRYEKFMDGQVQQVIENMEKLLSDIRSKIEHKIA